MDDSTGQAAGQPPQAPEPSPAPNAAWSLEGAPAHGVASGAQDSRWARRGLWVALGAVVVIVVQQAITSDVRSQALSGVLTGVASLMILVGATLLTPSSPGRRGLSWVWFGPAVVILVLSGYHLHRFSYYGYYWLSFYESWLVTTVLAVLLAGGWLTLRGRSGLAFLALIAAPVVARTAEFLVVRLLFNTIPDSYFSHGCRNADLYGHAADHCQIWGMSYGDFDRFYWTVHGSLTKICLLIGVAAAAWISLALVPAERRRSERRAAIQAQYTAATLAVPVAARPDGTVAAVLPDGTVPGPQPGIVYVPVQVGAAPGIAPGVVPLAPGSTATNGLAVASLVLGLIGGSVLAIVFGHVARHQNRRTGRSGSGMALAGLILGYVWLAVTIAWVAFVVGAQSRPGYY